MRYKTPSGRVFVLASHGLAPWGKIVHDKLIALGCSKEYALAEFHNIAGSFQCSPK